MKIAEKLDNLNKKASQKILRIKRKPGDRVKRVEEDIKALWGPFLKAAERLACLLVLVPTALMEGVYEGIRRTVQKLNESM